MTHSNEIAAVIGNAIGAVALGLAATGNKVAAQTIISTFEASILSANSDLRTEILTALAAPKRVLDQIP